MRDTVFEAIIARLESRVVLSDEDRDAIRTLPFVQKLVDPSGYLVREGGQPKHCAFILSGFCFRQ